MWPSFDSFHSDSQSLFLQAPCIGFNTGHVNRSPSNRQPTLMYSLCRKELFPWLNACFIAQKRCERPLLFAQTAKADVGGRLPARSIPGAAGLFPSLFVETRADFSHIKVVNDRTGCHRFACSVSWAWFLLWAGRAALHFYSNPPKTIPCVIRVRNLSEAEKINLEGLDAAESGFISADPLHRYTRVTPALQR
ncbi:hypothetical protein GOODEAATRI_001845 [Goodea atripinnis]|uniref:Uncharacterized protein n=1 Tax=Goodea atripinnis TaxID=208336 RepID=A0ABV0PAL1_9TELE